ncbi:MAG: ribonuclease J [Campylobacterales bacterium]
MGSESEEREVKGEREPRELLRRSRRGRGALSPKPPLSKEQKGREKGFVWFKDLNRAFQENEKIHQQRLTSFNKNRSKGWVKFTPLGGLDEIGGNCAVLETENSAIIIDCGMSFPKEDLHGVDILIPDFSYLREIRPKIKGLVITHGHEDHIGAVPYLFKEMQVPIYGTSLPLGMIRHKFREQRMSQYEKYFRSVKKRHPIQIGDFKVEWIHMTHSIVDSSSLAIQTPAGTIIHTGDFKIDHTPIDGYPPDLHRLAYYGEQGVLALFSDSTNSYKPGVTPSERVVGKTFENIFLQANGRIIMSTFSSNIHRVYQAIQAAQKFNRKVAIIGRSMEQNLNLAMELGYIKFDPSIFIEPWEISKYPDNEVLIVTTGSQGESMSALYRMAVGEHRQVRLKEGDQIIISAKAIPGNEPAVSELINYLLKQGAKVAYQEFSEIHVSGHASQEEQKLMLRLVKPKYFFPVHGEFNHLVRHKETALETGIPEENIFIMEDGEQWEITPKRVRKVGKVKVGKIFIDNQLNEEIESDIVADRQKLAEEGIVIIVAQVDKKSRKLMSRPRVVTYGIIPDREDVSFSKEMEEMLINYLEHAKEQIFSRPRNMEDEIKKIVKKHMYRRTKKYPTIVPMITLR